MLLINRNLLYLKDTLDRSATNNSFCIQLPKYALPTAYLKYHFRIHVYEQTAYIVTVQSHQFEKKKKKLSIQPPGHGNVNNITITHIHTGSLKQIKYVFNLIEKYCVVQAQFKFISIYYFGSPRNFTSPVRQGVPYFDGKYKITLT